MPKFDMNDFVSDLFNDNSKAEAVEVFRVQLIHIDMIKPSEDNFYGIRDIDIMAANIEQFGLDQNLVVKEKNAGGYYELIAGERRWRACRQLFDGGNKNFEYLPCKIKTESSEKINRLNLIYNNAMARELTDYEKMRQTAQIKETLYELKAEGYEFKGRMSEIVAKILDVSRAQVDRLEKVNKDLSDDFKEELKNGETGNNGGV